MPQLPALDGTKAKIRTGPVEIGDCRILLVQVLNNNKAILPRQTRTKLNASTCYYATKSMWPCNSTLPWTLPAITGHKGYNKALDGESASHYETGISFLLPAQGYRPRCMRMLEHADTEKL